MKKSTVLNIKIKWEKLQSGQAVYRQTSIPRHENHAMAH